MPSSRQVRSLQTSRLVLSRILRREEGEHSICQLCFGGRPDRRHALQLSLGIHFLNGHQGSRHRLRLLVYGFGQMEACRSIEDELGRASKARSRKARCFRYPPEARATVVDAGRLGFIINANRCRMGDLSRLRKLEVGLGRYSDQTQKPIQIPHPPHGIFFISVGLEW